MIPAALCCDMRDEWNWEDGSSTEVACDHDYHNTVMFVASCQACGISIISWVLGFKERAFLLEQHPD